MPSPSPVVSIVMATYNFERFLARAIDSALAQDYPAEALDIVVVDDGSTDSTPEVVRPYLDRVRYIRKPNGGLLTTVNRGLAEARGEFISLLSGDDEFLPARPARRSTSCSRTRRWAWSTPTSRWWTTTAAASPVAVGGRQAAPGARPGVRRAAHEERGVRRRDDVPLLAEAGLPPDPGHGRLGGLVHRAEDRGGRGDRLHPAGRLPLPLPRRQHEPGGEGRQDGGAAAHGAEVPPLAARGARARARDRRRARCPAGPRSTRP